MLGTISPASRALGLLAATREYRISPGAMPRERAVTSNKHLLECHIPKPAEQRSLQALLAASRFNSQHFVCAAHEDFIISRSRRQSRANGRMHLPPALHRVHACRSMQTKVGTCLALNFDLQFHFRALLKIGRIWQSPNRLNVLLGLYFPHARHGFLEESGGTSQLAPRR